MRLGSARESVGEGGEAPGGSDGVAGRDDGKDVVGLQEDVGVIGKASYRGGFGAGYGVLTVEPSMPVFNVLNQRCEWL